MVGEGNGNPLQYSCLENPVDREAWQVIDPGVARLGHDLATKPPAPNYGSGEGNGNPLQYSCRGFEESNTTERLHFHVSLSCIGEGNGNPLQCSCLENPKDGGAW